MARAPPVCLGCFWLSESAASPLPSQGNLSQLNLVAQLGLDKVFREACPQGGPIEQISCPTSGWVVGVSRPSASPAVGYW